MFNIRAEENSVVPIIETMQVYAVVSVFFVALSAVSLVSTQDQQGFTEEQKKQILKNRQDCIKDTKVDPALILRADEGDFADDKNLKCFTKCFYNKAGFVSEQGEVDKDAIKAKIPAESLEEILQIVEKCQYKGQDPCDTVYQIHKCYFQYTHTEIINKKETTEDKKA